MTKLNSAEHIAITERYSTRNYAPLDVVLSEGRGVWVTDVDGHRYLDMLSAYSALNFGHCNPRFEKVAIDQLRRLPLTSRAFYNDQLGLFCKELAEFSGTEMVIPMNSGAEAVETSVKCARRWGYEIKGVAANQAEIITFEGNFHGRTTTIVSFSSAEESRKGYGPFTPGFTIVSYGDGAALERAITKNTVGILVEPIQGEGGVIIPPLGFLKKIRELCDKNNILMIADEVQTGLCRTGKRFACEHEDVKPDLYILGKSLGAGIIPISAVMGSQKVLGVFTPGTHGSTFGGNPFACAIAREVLKYIVEEKPEEKATEMGKYFLTRLEAIKSPYIRAIRQRGLMIGVDIAPEHGKAKPFCKKLKGEGVLCKDTRDQTLRFAPPLTISKDEIDWGLEKIEKVFAK